MNTQTKKKIKKLLYILDDFYLRNKRDALPWRRNITPYTVLVSEIMLQQTQVSRVEPFFKAWMKEFPSWKKLAHASQVQVLRLWKGLGYNSRALRLQQLAKLLVSKHSGRLPKHKRELEALPGIGLYTAGAVRAFAYNEWELFIETNIRTVIFHHLMQGEDNISDAQVLGLLKDLVHMTQQENVFDARHLYYALMDYGAYLKQEKGVRLNKKSKHYTKQKKFKGSDREIRGVILDLLLHYERLTFKKLQQLVTEKIGNRTEERVRNILSMLADEGFVTKSGWSFVLKK